MTTDEQGMGMKALVRQEQPFGCTAACLAMILGCTYAEAAAKLASDPSIFDTQGSGYHVMESQLVNHGFAISRKWRVFQPGNQPREPWPCEPFADLHWCEVIAGPRGAHAVILLRDGTILDPMTDEPKTLSDYSEVNFVAAIVPLRTIPPQPSVATDDVVERVARALAGRCGCSSSWEAWRKEAELALEASHHAELVGALKDLRAYAYGASAPAIQRADAILAKISGDA